MVKKVIPTVSLAVALVCVLCAPALGAYHIGAEGAEARGEDVYFNLGEEVSFVCEKAVSKQPNTTGEELVTEEQLLITTFSYCSGKAGAVPIEATISPEIRFVIGPGEATSETTLNHIPLTFEEAFVVRIRAESPESECAVTVPAVKDLNELTWRTLNAEPGAYESEFAFSVSGEAGTGGGACDLYFKKPDAEIGIRTLVPMVQEDEMDIG